MWSIKVKHPNQHRSHHALAKKTNFLFLLIIWLFMNKLIISSIHKYHTYPIMELQMSSSQVILLYLYENSKYSEAIFCRQCFSCTFVQVRIIVNKMQLWNRHKWSKSSTLLPHYDNKFIEGVEICARPNRLMPRLMK